VTEPRRAVDIEVPRRKELPRNEGASLSGGGRAVDIDELARLEEERDFLLRSIEDLDREHDAGDVDPDDYDELRRGYVARAAEAIRSVEAGTADLAARQAAAKAGRTRVFVWTAAVLAFTVVAGVLLANALGSRSEGGIVTGEGSMPGSDRDRCRSLSMSKPAEGIACYDELLKDRPDDVDALTYQGWAKVRSGDVAGGAALFDRVVALDPTYPDVHVFTASVLKNAGDFAGAQAELDRLYALNPSPVITSTLQQMGLDREVAVGLLPTDVAACWTQEEAALAATVTATGRPEAEWDRKEIAGALADVAISAKCLDAVIAQRADADALVLRSLAVGVLGLLDPGTFPRAEADASAALAARADDPTALVLRAMWRNNTGDSAGALADLDAVGDRRISPLVSPYAPVDQVRATVEADRAASATTTTSTP